MLTVANVFSNFVENGFRKIKFLMFGDNDVRTARQITPFGIDSSPVKGLVGLYAQTKKDGKPVLIGYMNQSLMAEVGELRTYSTDEEGNLMTFIWLKNDGTMEIGGDADNMVRFSELKAGFDKLVDDHNDLVTAFNAHMHPTAASGPPSPPSPGSGIPAQPSTASVDDSKIDEIKTL